MQICQEFNYVFCNNFERITHKSKGFKIAAGFKAEDGVGIMNWTGKCMYGCVKSSSMMRLEVGLTAPISISHS